MVIAKGTSRKRVDLPVEVTFKEVIVSGDSAGATNYLFIQRDIMHNVRRDQSLKTTPSMYALLAVRPSSFRPQPIDQFRWHAHIRYHHCRP